MTKVNYSQVEKINGKKVVNAGLSSEHTQYFGENKNYGKFLVIVGLKMKMEKIGISQQI